VPKWFAASPPMSVDLGEQRRCRNCTGVVALRVYQHAKSAGEKLSIAPSR
jgi:hypothetical protein